MNYTCELKEFTAQPTVYVRTCAAAQDLPAVMEHVFGALAQYLGMLGESPAGMPYAAYFNMDMQDLDVEIGFPVSEALPGQGDIQAGEFPSGKMATCLYIGPYADMGPAYDALNAWMQANGYVPTGVAYEMYLNDPRQIPSEEPRTLIVFPLT